MLMVSKKKIIFFALLIVTAINNFFSYSPFSLFQEEQSETHTQTNEISVDVAFVAKDYLYVTVNNMNESAQKTAYLWLDNSSNTKKVVFTGNSFGIQVVSGNWQKINIMIENKTFSLPKEQIKNDYQHLLDIANSIIIILLLTSIAIVGYIYFTTQKPKLITFTLPAKPRDNPKIKVTLTTINESIDQMKQSFGYEPLFNTTELRQKLENILSLKGIREPISDYSVHKLIQKLIKNGFLSEYRGYYYRKQKLEKPEVIMTINRLRNYLLERGIHYTVENINDLPAIKISQHYLITDRSQINILLKKRANFLYMCHEAHNLLNLELTYRHYTKLGLCSFALEDNFKNSVMY